MSRWDYWHHIDYHRKLPRGERVLEYTEIVQDHGWCLRRTGMTREQWLTVYTRSCAEGFLGRVSAAPGVWVVIVWRTPRDARRHVVCSIELPWRTHRSDAERTKP
ncbi:hypothetical protein [Gandjariella thermophila]|nr:hypothetical protein [Gandjariella thermophila]